MSAYASTGDARTAYTLSGDGPPLLLIHGAEADRHMFDSIATILDKRFTVITYDQRECGETECPARESSLGELALDASALVRSLGFSRVHVFGSSFGGRIAQALATQAGGVVGKLALGSTWPLPDALSILNPSGSQAMSELRKGLPETANRLAALFFPEQFLAQRPEFLDVFKKVRPASERATRRAHAVNSSMDISFADIKVPTLLLAGDSDRIVPPHVTFAMEKRIANVRKVLLAGTGHATCLQAPADVAEVLIRFFEENHEPH